MRHGLWCSLLQSQADFLPAEGPLPGCPLLAFSNILKDLDQWLHHAKAVALDKAVPLNSLKIFPKRLVKARALLWKNNKSDQLQSSKLTLETQSQLLIKLLGLAIPELVARKSQATGIVQVSVFVDRRCQPQLLVVGFFCSMQPNLPGVVEEPIKVNHV